MLSMKKVKRIFVAAVALGCVSIGQTAYAQEQSTDVQEQTSQEAKFSEAELSQFVQANSKVTAIQKEGQQSMVSIIEEANMNLERFNELAKAQREQKLAESGASPEELTAFDNAAQRIVQIQPEVKENVKKAIEEEGLTEEKYKAIVLAYQQDPEVKAKVHELLAK